VADYYLATEAGEPLVGRQAGTVRGAIAAPLTDSSIRASNREEVLLLNAEFDA